MEVTIALGHFCDTHGPCVILCTDRVSEIPENVVPSLNVPICDACQSLDLKTVYSCKDDTSYYISTRTAITKNMANILKDAVLRSLSVEVVQEENKDSGTMYFGDDDRGHIIAHVFDLKDTLARGFKRKYCIVVFGKQQIPLLNHYYFIEKNLQIISKELQENAAKVNMAEQSEKSQREIRQSKECKLRSLPYLVGEEHVFGHLHMWFVFLLRSEIYKIIPHPIPDCPIECSTVGKLRDLYFDLTKDMFKKIAYCILTGITVMEDNVDIIRHFQQLLPRKFVIPTGGKVCKVLKRYNVVVNFEGTLPTNLPKLYRSVEAILQNKNISESTLQYQIMSVIMRWFNIACVIGWTPNKSDVLFKSLGVQKCDMPLISYWVPQSKACVELCTTEEWFKKCNKSNS